MFTFPRAMKKNTWQGQGALRPNGMLPYYGGSGLGLCFGVSVVWLNDDSADKMAVVDLCLKKKNLIEDCQIAIHKNDTSNTSEKALINDTADDLKALYPISFKAPGTRRSYTAAGGDDGLCSHAVLDVLAGTGDGGYLLCFYFRQPTGGKLEAHAIALYADGSSLLLMDPNWGIGSYLSRAAMCNDLHALLASYIPTGRLEKVFLLEYEAPNPFGAFT